MKSLRKLLLSRFIIIVVAHTLIVLLAVYGITYLNIRNSVNWDLKRIHQQLIDSLSEEGGRERFDTLLDSLNIGEERQVSYSVYEEGSLLYGVPSTVEKQPIELKVQFHSYKDWSFARVSKEDGKLLISTIRADLDFIDDTLWILLLSLPLTLIPAMVFANRSFRAVVEPVREISSTLGQVEKGDLSKRVEGQAKNEEINTLIDRMNEALGTLEESFQHAERFNANAAHELKTPLASIRGEIDVCLQNERSQEEYEDCLVKCQDEIRHMDEVLKILLLISAPGDSMKNSFSEMELKEVYNESADLLRLLAEEKDIDLMEELELVKQNGSSELMKRAFFNLVENAVKYSSKDSQIKVILNRSVFSVEDSARLISDSEKEEILKPFHRLESGESGAGLGLSLVNWIVKLHGFRLQISSGKSGNIFSIYFS